MNYEGILLQYREGQLPKMWEEEKILQMQNHPELHQTTCGDMAAAKIAVLAGREIAGLNQFYREHRRDMTSFPEQADLYDWIFAEERYHLRSEIIDMSGCRAICSYEQDFIDGLFS